MLLEVEVGEEEGGCVRAVIVATVGVHVLVVDIIRVTQSGAGRALKSVSPHGVSVVGCSSDLLVAYHRSHQVELASAASLQFVQLQALIGKLA
jgi:hypothetical protein